MFKRRDMIVFDDDQCIRKTEGEIKKLNKKLSEYQHKYIFIVGILPIFFGT